MDSIPIMIPKVQAIKTEVAQNHLNVANHPPSSSNALRIVNDRNTSESSACARDKAHSRK